MPECKTVFVTGGAGYIGSHTIVELLNANYDVIVVDNFTNSVNDENGNSIALKRVETITGKCIRFYTLDLLDIKALDEVFQKVFNQLRSLLRKSVHHHLKLLQYH